MDSSVAFELVQLSERKLLQEVCDFFYFLFLSSFKVLTLLPS